MSTPKRIVGHFAPPTDKSFENVLIWEEVSLKDWRKAEQNALPLDKGCVTPGTDNEEDNITIRVNLLRINELRDLLKKMGIWEELTKEVKA